MSLIEFHDDQSYSEANILSQMIYNKMVSSHWKCENPKSIFDSKPNEVFKVQIYQKSNQHIHLQCMTLFDNLIVHVQILPHGKSFRAKFRLSQFVVDHNIIQHGISSTHESTKIGRWICQINKFNKKFQLSILNKLSTQHLTQIPELNHLSDEILLPIFMFLDPHSVKCAVSMSKDFSRFYEHEWIKKQMRLLHSMTKIEDNQQHLPFDSLRSFLHRQSEIVGIHPYGFQFEFERPETNRLFLRRNLSPRHSPFSRIPYLFDR